MRWYTEQDVKVIVSFQEERSRGEHNLTNITKTHERMQVEQKSAYPNYYGCELRSAE